MPGQVSQSTTLDLASFSFLFSFFLYDPLDLKKLARLVPSQFRPPSILSPTITLEAQGGSDTVLG